MYTFNGRSIVMKDIYIVAAGAVGVAANYLFGGWDKCLSALVIFMAIDFLSGIAAAVFSKSDKSADGKLWSVAMFRGLCKKGMGLFFVIVGYQLDLLVGAEYIRTAVIFCFLANELLSIVENAGAMGVWVPSVVKRMITVLNEKASDNEKGV